MIDTLKKAILKASDEARDLRIRARKTLERARLSTGEERDRLLQEYQKLYEKRMSGRDYRRSLYLAYGFLRNRSYKSIEKKTAHLDPTICRCVLESNLSLPSRGVRSSTSPHFNPR